MKYLAMWMTTGMPLSEGLAADQQPIDKPKLLWKSMTIASSGAIFWPSLIL
jgi:hypothetical protein